jgi:hypothetical protein
MILETALAVQTLMVVVVSVQHLAFAHIATRSGSRIRAEARARWDSRKEVSAKVEIEPPQRKGSRRRRRASDRRRRRRRREDGD